MKTRRTLFELSILIIVALNLGESRNRTTCLDDDFKCSYNKRYITRAAYCDGFDNCGDGSDEITYSRGIHKSLGIPCKNSVTGSSCLLPWRHVCDGGAQCYDNSDECNCETSDLYCNGKSDCLLGIDECFCDENNKRTNSTHLDDHCFRCLDGSKVISLVHLCDGIIDCDDLSDECLCLTREGDLSLPFCDDVLCWGDDCNKCSVPCNSQKNSQLQCISSQNICNGRAECPGVVDEKYCKKTSDATCTDADDDDGLPNCDYECPRTKKRTKKCDGVPECYFLEEECSPELCPNQTLPEFCNFTIGSGRFFRCSYGRNLKGWEVCGGLPDCNGSTPSQAEDEIYCPNKFFCKDQQPLHIPIEKKCDLIQDCTDNSDELGCNGKFHFYCDEKGITKYINKAKQVCDGNADCDSSSDECQNCTQGVFSSDEAMISTTPLEPFLWIISIFATVGNIIAISFTIKKITSKRFKGATNLEQSQSLMIFSLSLGDVLVSIYTAAIIIKNEMFKSSGRYCLRDQEWRSSATCSAIGVLMMIGSEASVFTLTVITAFRLRTIRRPTGNQQVRLIALSLGLGWILAIFVATIPLIATPSIEDYFVESIWYSRNHFISFIERGQVESFTKKLLVLGNKTTSYIEQHGSIGSWSLIEALLNELNPKLIPDRKFGYYSTHGVCLPRLFPDRSDTAWPFSLVIILINFFAFLFIFVSYITIFRLATQSRIKKSTNSNHSAMLQRKVTAIVVTDFCCWVPVAIMAFLQFSGINIPNEVYVPVGTILIPINSALNPILYSNVPDWLWNKLIPVRAWMHEEAIHIHEYSARIRSMVHSEQHEIQVEIQTIQTNNETNRKNDDDATSGRTTEPRSRKNKEAGGVEFKPREDSGLARNESSNVDEILDLDL